LNFDFEHFLKSIVLHLEGEAVDSADNHPLKNLFATI